MLSKEGRSIRRLAQVEGENIFSIQRKVKSDSDICYKIVNEKLDNSTRNPFKTMKNKHK